MPTENEKQLTAVQILIDELIKYGLVPKGTHKDNVLFHKALATERQQLIDAVKYGHNDAHKVNSDLSFEEYYSQTFKTQ
jgi:ATP phosphoribosyltransferase regulatory subunit HisZ